MERPLPSWVTSNADSLRREAAPYVGLTPAQRGELLAAACRAAMKQACARADAARVFSWRDPLPDSSVALLSKLRDEYRKRLG